MTDGASRAVPAATLTWSWNTETKQWLVEAHSMRNGSRSFIASCWVKRSYPLRDHELVQLLHIAADYWDGYEPY
jgi:hypothetical protein